MAPITVTVDTNNLAPDEMAKLTAAADGLEIEFEHVSVSDREMAGFEPRPRSGQIVETAVWDESPWDGAIWGGSIASDPAPARTIPEAWVLGESPLGAPVLAGADESARFERLLALISRNGFPPPGQRGNLTPGHRRHLRDAMIVSAHIREGRDVLVSEDWNRSPSGAPAVRDLISQEFAARES